MFHLISMLPTNISGIWVVESHSVFDAISSHSISNSKFGDNFIIQSGLVSGTRQPFSCWCICGALLSTFYNSLALKQIF